MNNKQRHKQVLSSLSDQLKIWDELCNSSERDHVRYDRAFGKDICAQLLVIREARLQ